MALNGEQWQEPYLEAGIGWTGLSGLEVVHRVNRPAVDAHLEVQVGAE